MPKRATRKPSTVLIEAGGPTAQHHLLSITPTTPTQKESLRPYSNSRLVAMNTCPTWGVVSAQKRYNTTARAMALEAGALMHEVFAAVRIWQLHHRQHLPAHAAATAHRLFGVEKGEPNYFGQRFDSNRWSKAWTASERAKTDREKLLILCYEIMHNGGWKDDPYDKNRTLSSFELATGVYIDNVLKIMDTFAIYTAGGPYDVVGIENVFDVVLTYDDGKQFRFIGTLDGLTYDLVNKRYTLEDNKTSVRLDVGWKAQFELSHQVTGYNACAAAVYGFDIHNSRILGLKIKPSYSGEDYWSTHTSRTAEQFHRWAFWLRHTAEQYEYYENHYEYAPRYTHSCNRYFRPCSLTSFCGDTFEGRMEQWEQMVPAKQSPSEIAAED